MEELIFDLTECDYSYEKYSAFFFSVVLFVPNILRNLGIVPASRYLGEENWDRETHRFACVAPWVVYAYTVPILLQFKREEHKAKETIYGL